MNRDLQAEVFSYKVSSNGQTRSLGTRPIVLILGNSGTGGVSMFALLLCVAAGITPIITSSSDEKLESIQKLNRNIRGTNYKRNPDQAAEVMRITDGKGVDIVVNNTGVASIPADIASLRARNGVISLVGFLEGLTARWDPAVIFGLMGKSAKLKLVQASPLTLRF
jgi:NADPH:quinone reductase-like Zn-dependent oxidoreductase